MTVIVPGRIYVLVVRVKKDHLLTVMVAVIAAPTPILEKWVKQIQLVVREWMSMGKEFPTVRCVVICGFNRCWAADIGVVKKIVVVGVVMMTMKLYGMIQKMSVMIIVIYYVTAVLSVIAPIKSLHSCG